MNRSNNNFHELPHERINTTLANPMCVILTFIGIFLIISSGGIIVFWLAYRHGMNMDLVALYDLQPPREEPLPTRFSISDSYFIPKHSYNKSTEDVFAASYLLESHYRAKGITNKYIQPNQYLEISKSLMHDHLLDFCTSENGVSSVFCSQMNHPDDHFIFSSINDSSNSIFPEAANQKTPNNPLKFSFSDPQIFSGVSTTKRSLLISGIPHSMTMPLPKARFWFPCTIDSNNKMCKDRLFQCSYNQAQYCYFTDFPIEGDFIESESTQIVSGHRQSLILLAYNDFFIPNNILSNFYHSQNSNSYSYKLYRSGANSPVYSANSYGGFILKTGRNITGHSIEYLIGNISNHQENILCPDPTNIFFWIPATFECSSKYLDITKCSSSKHVINGKKILTGATELICINDDFCEKDKKYVLLAENEKNLTAKLSFLETGTPVANVINLESRKIETIEKLPFQFLFHAFQPTQIKEPSSPEICGHIFYSYNAIRQISAHLAPGTESWRVFNVKIQWAKRSYPNISKEFDYTSIIESMRNITTVNLTEMYPFFY
ncbi:hypothetical protein TRFO_10152 [Tritrichomonas foetus]|uniref:Uncharacterized protein n=1 Tax=Tritrichomonas foetus TaxID=1144522 RepID=A0A1J4JD56_9EUKA|nr:hypothetical protein TRFO_10152 [Tritrichomonas foetus]|eukprot:OHS96207.1 hypothetical protein TRFO_10152 [Tritrichomonas foetus]